MHASRHPSLPVRLLKINNINTYSILTIIYLRICQDIWIDFPKKNTNTLPNIVYSFEYHWTNVRMNEWMNELINKYINTWVSATHSCYAWETWNYPSESELSVNIVGCHELEFWYMADHLKCIVCMFQHVVVVQCTEQCFYWIPRPRKYVCRHKDACMYPTLTSTGDIINLAIFGTSQVVI